MTRGAARILARGSRVWGEGGGGVPGWGGGGAKVEVSLGSEMTNRRYRGEVSPSGEPSILQQNIS